MKKHITTLALFASSILFASSAVADHRPWHESSKSVGEDVRYFSLGIDHYKANSDLGGGSENGLSAIYRVSATNAYGYDSEYRYLEQGDLDLHTLSIGLNYKLNLGDKGAYFLPQAGFYHMDLDLDEETSYYVGAELGFDKLTDDMDFAIYGRHYDMDNELFFNQNIFGARMTYHFDNDFAVSLKAEDIGDSDVYSLLGRITF